MYDPKLVRQYRARTTSRIGPFLAAAYLQSLIAVLLARIFAGAWADQPLPLLFILALVGMLPTLLATLLVWRLYGRFVQRLFALSTLREGMAYLWTRLFGSPKYGPFMVIQEGNIGPGGIERVQKIGGPGNLVIYANSAVVLSRAGVITRVVRGPEFMKQTPLQPFEKVLDTVDLRPQRWAFPVKALTREGIPVTYTADIKFRALNDDEAIFKAFKCKWIRDLSKTGEPWRLMTWQKRMIISATEGGLRGIIANYELDQLMEQRYRDEIRDILEQKLQSAAAGFGLEAYQVALGDIVFGWDELEKDERQKMVLDQWFEVWRTARKSEIQKSRVKANAQMLRTEEEARIEVRREMLERTVKIFRELRDQGGDAPMERMIILAFIEMIRNLELNLYTPDQILKTYQDLQLHLLKEDESEAEKA